jgi:hypothetical protein
MSLLLATGDYNTARKYLVDARKIEQHVLSNSSTEYLETTANLMFSHCLPDDQDTGSSVTELETALKAAVVERYELASIEEALGECYEYQRDFKPGVPHLQRAYDAIVNGTGESILLRARVSLHLAALFIRAEQPGIAEQL